MTESLAHQEARKAKLIRAIVHKYIAHKKRIFNASKVNEPLHIAQFNAALDVLNRELPMADDYSIAGYANVVLRNIDNLKKLLPHPNNTSYDGALDCLDVMIGLCGYFKKEYDA